MTTTSIKVGTAPNLEITPESRVLHFHEESTVIPLSQISSYHLNWHLHDPMFARKWWFLVLTVKLKSGEEECGPVAFVKFNYLSDRQDLQRKTRLFRLVQVVVTFSRGQTERRRIA
jgi:hypothetical protein